MHMADLGDIGLHWREDGNPHGAPIVFANSLGTDLRIWDKVVARLPGQYRILRYDMRGHGLSDCPPPPYSMGALVRDVERLLDQLEVRDAVFVGLSVGGMVAQGLAVKRLDLVRAMVLSNTAAKIGTKETWEDRVAAVKSGGLESLADGIMEKWFTAELRATPELRLWRNMVTRSPEQGYIGTCQAIAGTDFYTPTSGLTLPTLAIAGSEDGSTPPDLVRETAGLVRGSEFHLIRRSGHIPCVERPDDYTERLMEFLTAIGH
ncbi:3-oxoadipate enol-lactonase [Tropicimonas isoalkanivorans]|uniref:3-oxoadipate enol-lactonase n=1 Tax=Tropicimonas isoalkanivorans TaxID=441112 RepID=A0A1I1IIC6_9RHOB|nr:3-oxoadipate enol-lactonase [Tropicimonas isoalkanivorans]SFC35711.1 3-oxoadipate enol-lactonase [Tropicimonas isoalkanivorans]